MPTEPELRTERLAWMGAWADRHDCAIVQGECGFGHPCVGLQHRETGEQWVGLQYLDGDYRDAPGCLPWNEAMPPPGVETFDKSALLVVLIEGLGEVEAAYDGLFRWLLLIDQRGQTIKVVPKLMLDVSAMLGARTEAILAAG